MKLSIVTINYNNAEGLRKTLVSIASQTYRDIEHIIIDGGSTDGSVDVIKEYVRQFEIGDRRLKIDWVSEPDKGIYNAMNKGIRKATGDYVQILNSGDVLAAPDVTEKMISALNALNDEMSRLRLNEPHTLNDGVGILYGNMIRDYGSGKLSSDVVKVEGEACEVEWTMDDFINGTVNHDPTYIRADIYKRYGLYDEDLKIVSDWKWFVNAVVFGGEKLYYAPIDVTIFDTTGISETNLAAREKERRAELEKTLPIAILKDYDNYHFPIDQYKRLKRHHLWGFVYFMERVLFKLEKWHILRKYSVI